MKSVQDTLFRRWFASSMAVRNDMLSNATATTRTVIGTHCHLSIASGCRTLWMPSYNANRPPTLNSTMDTMNA